MKALWTSKTLWLTLLLLSGLAGLVWWQQKPILAWYHVRQLSHAYQDNREACAQRVAALEEAAVPALLEGLHDSDAIVCVNMQAALDLIATKWGVNDPRCRDLIVKLHEQFATFSVAGQEKTLLFLIAFMHRDSARPWPASLTRDVGELMQAAEKTDELRPVALLLAAELLECGEAGQWVDACRDLAERGMQDPLVGTRSAAVRLLLREPMRKNKQLLAKVVPLLQDREAVVRRVALVALASATDLVREDVLMPLLHDEDAEVQYTCELALRKHNLTDDDIYLARMITDKNPATRMKVLNFLTERPDLNLTEWVRQLSLDSSPAVRAAAVRAAGENPQVNLAQRLREMAEQDPSEAVRINAQFYLSQRLTQLATDRR